MTATLVVPTVGTYALDAARSGIAFTTRHLFGAAKVTGTFAISGGTLSVADPVTTSSVTAQASAASFTTGHDKRDTHVRSADFLDVQAHPTIAFSSTDVRLVDDRWVVAGELTVRGVAAPLEFAVTGTERVGDDLVVTAAATVDRYSHGIVQAKGMAAKNLALVVTAYLVAV